MVNSLVMFFSKTLGRGLLINLTATSSPDGLCLKDQVSPVPPLPVKGEERRRESVRESLSGERSEIVVG